MCCWILTIAVWAIVAGTLVKITADGFARRMPKPAAYLLGCVIAFGCTQVGGIAGVFIGGRIGAAQDQREAAKRQLSADNKRVSETALSFAGGVIGATAAMFLAAPVVAWLAARRDDDDET